MLSYNSDFCNETRGLLPCFDGTCYTVEQRCNQVRECVDGADEMGCKIIPFVSLVTNVNNLYDFYEKSSINWQQSLSGQCVKY